MIYLMALITALAIPLASIAQTLELNKHGMLVTYPNGDVISVGVSGDARLDKANGLTEYGYWQEDGSSIVIHLANRVIRINNRQSRGDRISGYCILKGEAVPDRLCW
jgi:hypothetical protein